MAKVGPKKTTFDHTAKQMPSKKADTGSLSKKVASQPIPTKPGRFAHKAKPVESSKVKSQASKVSKTLFG